MQNKGDRYVCPFCNFSASKFYEIGRPAPVLREKRIIGAGLREAGCFKCNSSDRERLLYAFLFEENRIQSDPFSGFKGYLLEGQVELELVVIRNFFGLEDQSLLEKEQ